jgi:hypothetical protein
MQTFLPYSDYARSVRVLDAHIPGSTYKEKT